MIDKTKFRKEYLASLHGHNSSAIDNKTYPKIKHPQKYSEFNNKQISNNGRSMDHNDMLEAYVISDQHFGHKNIIKYADRPFASVDHMDATMIENHNAIVGPNDVVFLLGDIGFCSTSQANDILDSLHGYKIFIIGNHDWEKNGKLKNYHVDEIHMSYYAKVGDERVIMTHVPFDSYILFEHDLTNIHGHIHDKKLPCSRFANVCVERMNYTPKTIESVIMSLDHIKWET